MTWGKVDDKLWGHPKWMATPAPARGLWISALSWCMDQDSDGIVPRHVLPFLGSTPRHANALVTSGLWEATDGGWQFHDWLEYQPDAASVKAKREAESDGGKRGAHTRWHTKKGVRVPDCPFCEGSSNGPSTHGVPDGGPHGEGDMGAIWGANAPDPAPARTRTNSSKRDSGTPRNARERDEPEPHPQADIQNVSAMLQAAGLPEREHRAFLVDLKATGARDTALVVNKLRRDGELPERITRWRDERDLATEAASRPAKSSRVAAHADLVQQFAAQEAAENVIPIRQIEGA
jgi:hypothetical protein